MQDTSAWAISPEHALLIHWVNMPLFAATGQFQRADCVEMNRHAVATPEYNRGTYLLQRIPHGPREAAKYGRTAVELKPVPLEGVSAAPRDGMALAHCYVQSVLETRFATHDVLRGVTSKNLMGHAGCIFFLSIPLVMTHSQSLQKGSMVTKIHTSWGQGRKSTKQPPEKNKNRAAAHIQGKSLEGYLDTGAEFGYS